MTWGEMTLMALLGFLVVVAVLTIMIFIMKGFGAAFTREPKKTVKKASAPASEDEVVAAIAAAIALSQKEAHDTESGVLTFNNVPRAYSPWNAKVHGLTEVPDRRVW